jgi:hypothetical protein
MPDMTDRFEIMGAGSWNDDGRAGETEEKAEAILGRWPWRSLPSLGDGEAAEAIHQSAPSEPLWRTTSIRLRLRVDCFTRKRVRNDGEIRTVSFGWRFA